jgi:hypothetical protein
MLDTFLLPHHLIISSYIVTQESECKKEHKKTQKALQDNVKQYSYYYYLKLL